MKSPDESRTEDSIKPARNPNRVPGFVIGSIIGVLVISIEILESSPSDFHNNSMIIYLLIVLAFGAVGAIFGDKFMETLLGWLSWL
jgi:hypothetical protein